MFVLRMGREDGMTRRGAATVMLIPVLLGITVITFAMRLIPGDPCR